MKLYKMFSAFSLRFVYILFGFALFFIAYTYISGGVQINSSFKCMGYTTFFILLFILCSKYFDRIQSYTEKRLLIYILLICFFFKFAVILYLKVEPKADYLTFYDTSVMLLEHSKIDSRYVSLFPHILGYSTFLSIFFKIFGVSYFLPSLINVILSVLSVFFIFKIGLKLGNKKTAVFASILWIFMPSQSIYNIFVLSEPLYTTMLLLVWYIIIEKVDFHNLSKKCSTILYIVACGIILSLINKCRPIALIPIIALLIYLFVIDLELVKKENVFKMISISFLLLITYFCSSQLASKYVDSRLLEKSASIPGFTLYVGFNEDSGGRWSIEDSETLYEYNTPERTPNEVQQIMMDLALQRVTEGDINYPSFFIEKFKTLWMTDDGAAKYASTAFNSTKKQQFAEDISNAYYLMLVIFALLGCIKAFLQKENNKIFMIFIFYIGLTLAHAFAEVAVRYHYAAMVSLIFAVAYFFNGSNESHFVNKNFKVNDN